MCAWIGSNSGCHCCTIGKLRLPTVRSSSVLKVGEPSRQLGLEYFTQSLKIWRYPQQRPGVLTVKTTGTRIPVTDTFVSNKGQEERDAGEGKRQETWEDSQWKEGSIPPASLIGKKLCANLSVPLNKALGSLLISLCDCVLANNLVFHKMSSSAKGRIWILVIKACN